MPPFDPRAHARLVGSLLGLTEGADGPFKFHIQPGAYEKLVEAITVANALYGIEDDQLKRYGAELSALYLPSLFALVFDHSLSTFDDVNPSLSGIAVNLLDKMVHSYAGFHFTRKHPAKVAQLGPKMAAKVLEVADELRSDPSESVLIHMLTDLVDIYNTLWIQDRLSTDATNTVDSLQILPALLFQLRIRYPLLEGFGPVLVSAGQDPSRYKQALKSFHAALFPEEYKTRRGSEFISCDIGGAKHSPWWTCDATHPTKGVTTSSACRVVPRADLLACGQCLSVRYCSRKHQKLHWKEHKPLCVAPTW